MKIKFYQMGTGRLIAEAGRGMTKKAIKALQEKEWARHQGGICNIIEYSSEHAIFFAQRNL